MAKPPRVADTTPSEGDFAQVAPRDLHPTSDIRFVMLEVQKLSTQVERLIADVRVLEAKVDPGQISRLADDLKEVKADAKEVKAKVSVVEHSMTFFKGAAWVIGVLFAVLVALAGLTFNAVRTLQPSASPAAPVNGAPAATSATAPAASAPPVLELGPAGGASGPSGGKPN